MAIATEMSDVFVRLHPEAEERLIDRIVAVLGGQMPQNKQAYYDTRDLARRLGCSKRVLEDCPEQIIGHCIIGGKHCFSADIIERYIARGEAHKIRAEQIKMLRVKRKREYEKKLLSEGKS